MLEMFVILPVELHAPRFCLPLELLVVCMRLICFEFVPVVRECPVAAGSADLDAWAICASCLAVTMFIIRATSMNLGWVNFLRMACSSERWIKLANWK